MLHGHCGGLQDPLEDGRVEPEEGHAEGEQDGREEVQVLGLLVEHGRVLEDGETAGPHSQEVEPLPAICQNVLTRMGDAHQAKGRTDLGAMGERRGGKLT